MGERHNRRIMDALAAETGGKSYKAYKYSLDDDERPSLDYGERDREIEWKRSAETNPSKTYTSLEDLYSKVNEQGDFLFTFFLDGSRHVFKVDDFGYEHSKGRSIIYPIIAGQIGVGCCKRVNRRLVPERLIHDIVLSVPDVADADGKSGFFPALTSKVNNRIADQGLNITVADIIPYKTSKDDTKYQDRATARIQDRMTNMEKELVATLVREKKLNQDNYLIKDGSLQYSPEDKRDKKKYQLFKNNYNWVIGVSKEFNPEILTDSNRRPNPGFIAELPLFHRTPVARYSGDYLGDLHLAVWYVRIREQSRTRAPFDGIVKVEKILVTEEEGDKGIDSSLVDTISANIILERNPVCYGSDLRWANHLYPVYLTEEYVKSRYFGTESFLHLF